MKRIFFALKEKWPEYILESIVIVGSILLAIWLENQNDDFNNRREEKILLLDLKSDLEKTYEGFVSDTIANAYSIKKLKRIESYIINDSPYSSELDTCFGYLLGWRSPFISSSAYQSLKSTGIEIIQNRELRNDIVNLYDVKLASVTEDYDRAEWVLYESTLIPFYTKNIKRFNTREVKIARPNDFQALKRSNEFLNSLSLVIYIRTVGIDMYKAAMEEINHTIETIDIELKE